MLAIPFPQIDPVLIELGPLVIRWYALSYLAGILGGWYLLNRIMLRPAIWGPQGAPADKKFIDDLMLWITLGIVFGGRLFYVLFYNFDHFINDPASIIRTWEGGMSFHGGLTGVVLVTIWYCKRKNVDMLRLGDAMAMVAPLGLMFGRLANFINGELWGRVTDVPWAMVFPGAGHLPRHPSQLYEAGLEGLLLFVVLFGLGMAGKLLPHRGRATGIFFIGYGLARIFVEFFREPDPQLGFLMQIGQGGITMGMILSLPLVLIGAGFILLGQKTK